MKREASISTRRQRTTAIQNEIRKLIKPCEYVFLIEDDGLLPDKAPSRLMTDYLAHPRPASSRVSNSAGGGSRTWERGERTTCTR